MLVPLQEPMRADELESLSIISEPAGCLQPHVKQCRVIFGPHWVSRHPWNLGLHARPPHFQLRYLQAHMNTPAQPHALHPCGPPSCGRPVTGVFHLIQTWNLKLNLKL